MARSPMPSWALVIAAGLGTLAGCSPARKPAPAARHLVLVTIDTLRADRLGCYGGSVATPHLDAIAREGAMAPQAMAHVPLTRPSHVSLFTGLLPSQHGIRDNVSPSLVPHVPALAPILKGAGFRTAGFVSSIVLSRQSGLDRGFDVYSDRFQAEGDDVRFLNTLQKRGDVTLAEALSWLSKSPKDQRLFLWLHLYDPHDPYDPPEPFASRYPGRPYDGEVAWTDELIGHLEDALDHEGLKADTLLVVIADHGEGLGDHAENVHGFFVYQSTLHIPLLFRGPGIRPGARLRTTARTVDILPTSLELLGVPLPASTKLEGRSLAAALRGADTLPEPPTYAESLLPLLHFGWSDLRTLREGRYKYIQAPRPELYDLESDPGETVNLAESDAAKAEAMRAALASYVEADRAATTGAGAAATVPPELLEKLGALGYLGAGAPGQGSNPGADPKDKIEEFKVANRLIREGLIKQQAKDYAGSAANFQELLKRRIESFEVHYYLGKALLGLKRYREAAPHFEGAIRFQPAYGMAHEALAECHAAEGDLKGAIAAIAKGREAAPTDPALPRLEGTYWERLGNRAEARRAYEAALPLAPKNAWLRVRLGEILRDAGDLERATVLLREAVGLEPSSASYWNSLGMVLGGRGQFGEAEKAFAEALSRDPSNAKYTFNLGLALLRQGRNDDAAPYFRKTLELDPSFGDARAQLDGMKRTTARQGK